MPEECGGALSSNTIKGQSGLFVVLREEEEEDGLPKGYGQVKQEEGQ